MVTQNCTPFTPPPPKKLCNQPKKFPYVNNEFCQVLIDIFIYFVTGFVGAGLGLSAREYLVWYVLFIVFVTYAMLPLPLRCCIIAGCTTALLHIIATSIVKFNKYMVRNFVEHFCKCSTS